jgi:hypothetical protein
VTKAGMARGKWASAREGGCWSSAGGGGEGAEGGAMIICKAWKKRIRPPAMIMAGTETRQFFKIIAPSRATLRTIIVAMTVARQAKARQNAGSAPRVTLANGPMAFSGPRVKKKMIKASETATWLRIDMVTPEV